MNTKQVLGMAIFAIALVLLSVEETAAQRVQPMVYEMDPAGSGASTSLRVENTKSVPMTLEFVASTLELDENGVEKNVDADDDFLIFPPQALIQPGKSQVVRVKYVGNPDLLESKAYRVSVKQLPITLEKSGSSGVAMLVNFNTLANVVPKDAKAKLGVVEITPEASGKWSIVVENSGNRFARLSKTQWVIESTDGLVKPVVLSKAQVGEMTDLNLVLPNSKLKQTIPAIAGFDPNKTRIIINQKG